MDRFDVVIVGAGPSGIATALTLQRLRRARVLLIDGGRAHRNRICPVDNGRHCKGCKGICNVISGFGGALHFGDAAKFSLLPSGRRLIELLGHERAVAVCDRAVKLLEELSLCSLKANCSPLKNEILARFSAADLEIRDYPVLTLSEAHVRILIDTAYARITSLATVCLGEDVLDIQRTGGEFTVYTTRRTITSSAVVIGTGRSGITKTQGFLETLGVRTVPPTPSIGVRFEFPASLTRKVGWAFPDLKISVRKHSGEKTKTFCLSAGPSGGRVKFCHYQDAFPKPFVFLDGHLVFDDVKHVPDPMVPANFAVLYKLQKTTSCTSDWIWSHFLRRYYALSRGRPIAETYVNFKLGIDTSFPTKWGDIKRSVGFRPSVDDFVVGNLHLLFEDGMRTEICETYERVLSCMSQKIELPASAGINNTLVYGPELEFFWDEVSINAECETQVPNLFIVGDSAGKAQGNLQAMMMGIAAGDCLVERLTKEPVSGVGV